MPTSVSAWRYPAIRAAVLERVAEAVMRPMVRMAQFMQSSLFAGRTP
jgi:hypothetical protein